jgi:TonB family protein
MKRENPDFMVSGRGSNPTNLVLIVISLALAWTMVSSPAICQTGSNSQKMDTIYQKVDKMPLFDGKEAGTFTEWVEKQIKYPEDAIKNKIVGRVVLRFVVEKDGSLSGIAVLKGVDQSLNLEAMRVVKSSPKWTPGMKNNVPVRVFMFAPVEFQMTFPSDAKLKVKQ